MLLGMKVGLGAGHIVLHGDPAPPKRGTPPIFGPCLLWANGRPSQMLLNTCLRQSVVHTTCQVPNVHSTSSSWHVGSGGSVADALLDCGAVTLPRRESR